MNIEAQGKDNMGYPLLKRSLLLWKSFAGKAEELRQWISKDKLSRCKESIFHLDMHETQ